MSNFYALLLTSLRLCVTIATVPNCCGGLADSSLVYMSGFDVYRKLSCYVCRGVDQLRDLFISRHEDESSVSSYVLCSSGRMFYVLVFVCLAPQFST